MKIHGRALTRCSVLPDGNGISLGMMDDDGKPFELHLSPDDAGAIALTLPKLLNASLGAKFKDNSLRFVFPIDKWRLEAASDGAQIIITLMTGDGFEASFACTPNISKSLGSGLLAGLAGATYPLTH